MRLIHTLLPLLAVCQSDVIGASISARGFDCHHDHYAGPVNPSFETGSLTGWTVVSGDTFGNASVVSDPTC
jgi:hypothetical protein